MEILNKQYILDKQENITVEFIEKAIINDGYTPLRWAIVKSSDDKITVDATVISKKD